MVESEEISRPMQSTLNNGEQAANGDAALIPVARKEPSPCNS